MTKKIIKVEETKKKENKSLDLGKITNVIKNNPTAVKKITEGISELITSDNKKTKKSSKKTTKSNSSSDLTKTIKTISSLLNK